MIKIHIKHAKIEYLALFSALKRYKSEGKIEYKISFCRPFCFLFDLARFGEMVCVDSRYR